MKLTTLLTALLLASIPGLASAAEVDSTKRIDQRQENQEQRIEKGRKSGELSKKEAERMENHQKRINRAESKAAQDGKVTEKERARLERMQDKESKAIRAQRKDDNKK
jgi:hypothetical protein